MIFLIGILLIVLALNLFCMILSFIVKVLGYKDISYKNIFIVVCLSLLIQIFIGLGIGSLRGLLNITKTLPIQSIGLLVGMISIVWILKYKYAIGIIKGIISIILTNILFLIIGLGVVFGTRFFVTTPFNIVGSSMSPVLNEKDFVLVEKFYQKFSIPYKRGDIIVFIPPGKNIPYFKRIIGLSGETVKINNNIVTICDSLNQCTILDESFLPTGTITETNCDKDTFQVTSGFFVMGDNRGASTDSRCCFSLYCKEDSNYIVPLDNIIGKIIIKLKPEVQIF